MKTVFRFLLLVCSFHTALDSLHAQWSQTSGPIQASVHELLYSGTNLFAGTNRGVYRSTDDGVNWIQVNNGLAGDTMIVALAVSGTTLFAGDWVNGVFRSTDNGANWTQVNSGMTDTYISDLLVSGTILFAGTGDGGGIFRSTNNGTSWAEITTGLGSYDGTVLTLSGTDILLGDNDCKIFRSTNNGTNWIQVSTGVTDTYISSLVVSGLNLFAGTQRGVFLSSDNGTNWTQVNNGLTDTTVKTLVLSGTDFFAGTPGGVFHSTDNGASWTQVNGGLTDTNITALVFSGTHLFAGTDTSGVYQGLLSALPVELTTFAATAKQNGVELHWRTASEVNNYGFEIERRETNSQFIKVGFVAGSGSSSSPHQYSYADRGIPAGRYVYRIKQIDKNGAFKYTQTVEVEVGSAPKQFSLSQNYPNPFNPATTIEFSVPEDGRAVLKIVDLLGRDVATLFEGDAKSGYYQRVVFDATRYASGVYFSRLEFGGKQQLKRMILMK